MSAQADLAQGLALLKAGESQHQVLARLQVQCAEWPYPVAGQLSRLLGFLGRTGAPARPALKQLLATHQRAQKLERQVQVALQAPVLTARLMKWLPLCSVALAQIAGLNPLAFLVLNPLGWLLVLAATGLNISGARWSAKIINGLGLDSQPQLAPALQLTGLALMAGLSCRQALAECQTLWPEQQPQVAQLLAQHQLSGISLHTLLLAQAQQVQSEHQQQLAQQLARLPIKLLGPMSLCYLPAFMMLAVVPIAVTAITK